MKTIVYYYSMTGYCERLAGKIADRLKCDFEGIRESRKRLSRGFLRFLNGRDAIMGRASKITPVGNDPVHFERIVFVTPIWAGRPTPAIRGFLKRYLPDLNGKKLGLILANQGSDPVAAFDEHRKILPEPLVWKSFTASRGEWQGSAEEEAITRFVTDFDRS